MTELRACINDLRAQVSLGPVVWTDPVLSAGDIWIRAVHITELRTAISAVFVAEEAWPPVFTDASLAAQSSVVRAIHITELRQAALLIAGACPPEECGQGPGEDRIEYYHLDGLGSVRAVTDELGAVVRRHDYFPFGEGDLPQSGEDSLRFTGKEGDAETGLSYFGARYHRARIGRFTTVDPGHVAGNLFDPQGWNAYAYALNNPASVIDPDGRCAYFHCVTIAARDPIGGFGAGVAGSWRDPFGGGAGGSGGGSSSDRGSPGRAAGDGGGGSGPRPGTPGEGDGDGVDPGADPEAPQNPDAPSPTSAVIAASGPVAPPAPPRSRRSEV